MLLKHSSFRSPVGVATIAAFALAASGAGAATLHRFAISSPAGSLGAQTFVQSSANQGALQSEVSASPTTNFTTPFATLGLYDPKSTTFGIGVAGISSTGYGVAGEAMGINPAVLALNLGKGDGLDAFSRSSSPAITAQSAGPAIVATSTAADGLDATENAASAANAISATSTSPYGNALYATSRGSSADAAYVLSNHGNGIYAVSNFGSSTFGRASVYAATGQLGTDLFQASSSNGDYPQVESFEITSQSIDEDPNYQQPQVIEGGADVGTSDVINNGDLYLAGAIFTGCTQLFPINPDSCTGSNAASADATKTSSGQRVATYASRNTTPTMEDEGETRLTNGYAHVALDSGFASTIATSKPYLVFPVPMGDCRGLYVSNRTSSGFDVRELGGGRSNVTIDYRIVAHPFANDAKRLAAIPRARPHTVRAGDAQMTEHDRLTAATARTANAFKIATPRELLSK